jgi:hypothetical protein
MAYGTNSVLDALLAIDNANVYDYGEDRLLADFQRSLAAHNALVDDMLGDLAESTTDRIRRFGVDTKLSMTEIDEYTRADAQKVPPTGSDIGFPLKGYQISLQWTRRYLQVATPAELAAKMNAAQRADISNVRVQALKALFTPTNTTTYKDRMIDNVTLPLRALLNADSEPIPDNDYGTTFDGSTHTHYLGTASFVAANIVSLVSTIVEHGVNGPVQIYINPAQEAAVSAFANFVPLQYPNLTPGGGQTTPIGDGVRAPFEIYNRQIGWWDGAIPVWVKAWVPAAYVLAFEADPSRRVLVRRRRAVGGNTDALAIVAEDEKYPLRAQTLEREFGISVWGRDQAAVLKTDNATYSAPTIT